MTAALKNRVRPVVGSLALGSTLVLSGCVTDLTGIGAGSDFACPMDDGTLCASMADISQMSRRGELPWEERREAARARAEAEGLDAANAPASGDSDGANTSDKAQPHEPQRVKGVANAVSSSESSDNSSVNATSSAKAAPAKGASAAEAVASAEAHETELRPGFRPNRSLGARLTESWGRSPLTAWATPERTPERLVRIFVAPWTDRDGDLHDAHYVYAAVTPPEWNTARRRRPDGRAVVKLPFELNRPARTDRTREVENLDAAYGTYGSFGSYGEFDAVRVDDVKDPFGYPAESASETDANRSGAERLRADRARQMSAARKLAAPAAAFGGVDSPDASEVSDTSGAATPEASEPPRKPDAS